MAEEDNSFFKSPAARVWKALLLSGNEGFGGERGAGEKGVRSYPPVPAGRLLRVPAVHLDGGIAVVVVSPTSAARISRSGGGVSLLDGWTRLRRRARSAGSGVLGRTAVGWLLLAASSVLRRRRAGAGRRHTSSRGLVLRAGLPVLRWRGGRARPAHSVGGAG